MANTITSWDITVPVKATDLIENGADEIRFLRTGVGVRMAKEHVAPDDAGVGFEHVQGSAVGFSGAYGVDNASAPATRANGDAFTADDHGRLAFNTDTGTLLVLTAYDGATPDLKWSPVVGIESTYLEYLAADGKLTRKFVAGEVIQAQVIGSLHADLGTNGIATEIAGVADGDSAEIAATNLATTIKTFTITPKYTNSKIRIRGNLPGFFFGSLVSLGVMEGATILAAQVHIRGTNNGMHSLPFDFILAASGALTERTLLLKGSARYSASYYFDICHLTHTIASNFLMASLSIEEIAQ